MILHRQLRAWAALLPLTLLTSEICYALDTKFTGSARYRYETYDWDDKGAISGDRESIASTLRLGLTADVTVNSFAGFFLDLESVQQVGDDDYAVPFHPTQVKPNAAPIADPQGEDLNQAYVRFLLPGKTTVKAGTQELFINDGRFISNSAWRQNHQSLNAATLSNQFITNLSVDYGYLTRVFRVTGEDASNGRADMESHFVNVGYTFANIGVFKAYAYLLDFDDEITNSTDSYGVRYEPAIAIGDSIKLIGLLEYATQKEAGDNPLDINADYLAAEAGVAVGGISYKGGYKILEGDGTNKFTTPLAHPHNGWTELFLVTPNDGLKLWMLSANGSIPGVSGLSFTAVYYDYSPDTDNGIALGSELDLGMEYKSPDNWLTGFRFAQYSADSDDDRFQDALRASVYAVLNF
jgi:hypothetical protein